MADPGVSQIIDDVKAKARAKLLDLLDEVAGRKVLILDSTIVGPLDFIVSPNDLEDHGVQHPWYKLSNQVVTSDCSQMIFLVRCTRVEQMDWIAAQIIEDERQGLDRMYEVIFVPRKTEQALERLKKGNVHANVRIGEYGLNFVPVDKDVMSMEMPGAFRDVHVQGDPSCLFYAAKALTALQAQFGVIPSVHAIGAAGKGVLDIMLRLRKEDSMSEAMKDPPLSKEQGQPGVPPVAPRGSQRSDAAAGTTSVKPGAAARAGNSRISEVILIDRRVDLFSVLCSQFTYQALIDTVFGITNNSADVSGANFAKDRSQHVRLSPDEPLIQEIRDLHIDKLGPLLQQRAMAIQTVYAEKDQVKNPTEMAEYVKKFKTAQSAHPLLEMHINLATHLSGVIQDEAYRAQLKIEDDITAQSSQNILESLEDYTDDQKPLHEVLRLLCLYSLVNNGVKVKQLDQLKRYILQSYGYKHLLTLSNMEKTGLLRYHQGKSLWSNIKRHFNLLVEDASAERDVSYAYSGYAPLTVRLVQMTKQRPSGWRSCQDALSLLYGPAQVLEQPSDVGGQGASRDASQPSITLVCFIGGVTYGEVAALRKLSELEEGRRRFLIVTTEFTNARKFFETLSDEQVVKNAAVESSRRPKTQEQRRGVLGFWPGSR